MALPDFNPFTSAHDRIWYLLEAYDGFTGLVKTKNRIKVTALKPDQHPIKEEVLDADVPEAMLLQGAFAMTPFDSSIAATIVQDFILTLTGPNIDAAITNKLKLATLIALAKGGPHLGLIDTQLGQFCDRWELLEGGDKLQSSDKAGLRFRNISVLTIKCHMRLPTGWLQAQ
jgi:hypothetical protein